MRTGAMQNARADMMTGSNRATHNVTIDTPENMPVRIKERIESSALAA